MALGRAADVDHFEQEVLALITEAASYAQGGTYNPQVDAVMRRLRVLTSALQTALGTVQITAPLQTPGGP